MTFCKKRVDLVTIRKPLPMRYKKFYKTISKIARVNLVTGTLIPTFDLGMNINTVLSYGMLFLRSIRNGSPTLMDVNASIYALLKGGMGMIIDFRTPYPLELAWLGHRNLASLAKRMEKAVQNRLVIAANDKMASLCRELGASCVHVVPNYPTEDFKPTMTPEKWKARYNLAPDGQIVLFTGSNTGWKIKSIYGLDLLLESWKIVESSTNAELLVLGGEKARGYVYMRMRSLGIHRLLFRNNVGQTDLANWINCADVCLAPRTPGFPKRFYDDKDSNKISEYAALEKPIVAAGYAPSSQYLLVDQTPENFAEGIIKGLNGRIAPPKPHYWEENETSLLEMLEDTWFA